MGKPLIPILLIVCASVASFTLTATAVAAIESAKNFKIVIDPGHGGADLGAVHQDKKERFSEKEATLKLAQELSRQLGKLGYPVILTRNQDADLALNARTAIANREKARLFISIHMNSLPPTPKSKGAEGVETYILNNASDASSRRLAELENKGINPNQGSELTKESEVNLILKDLTLDANLTESKRLACVLQSHLVSVTKQKTRGVKQALFVVLLGADMPSVLLEAGFVSSEKDRKLHNSPHGIRAMAAGMVRAIEQFRTQAGTPEAAKTLGSCLVH